MKTYHIALLPGDGIGPEVMAPTLDVLQAVSKLIGRFELAYTSHDAGAERYRRTGVALPEESLADCLKADAVLLSAIGLPDVRMIDGTEVQPVMMVGLRRAMKLHSAIRPIKLYPGVPTPLKNVGAGIDFVILRENLEGLFASFGKGTLEESRATDTIEVTRAGTTAVSNTGFQLAAKRRGRPLDGKKLVTCVDKANVFRSFAYFRRVFFDVAAKWPKISADAAYVDAMCLYLVQNPQAYDILVMENQFGDILSDLGAGLVGGLGLAPSAEVGDTHGLFQPSHGTAPTIAGMNIANPLAMILSASMMLGWLGDKHRDASLTLASEQIEAAVTEVLAIQQHHSRDLGGTTGTREVGEAVVARLHVRA